MATIWCALNALVSAWLRFGAHWMLRTLNFVWRKQLSKRFSRALQLIQNGSSLCYPAQARWRQIRMNCQGNQQSKIRKPHALALLWLLSGVCWMLECPPNDLLCCAHWMLRTYNLMSAKTIGETTQQRITIDPKNGSSPCYPFSNPRMPNTNNLQ